MAIQPITENDHFWEEYREFWRVPFWPFVLVPFAAAAILVTVALILL